jgi:hypothetical protein
VVGETDKDDVAVLTRMTCVGEVKGSVCTDRMCPGLVNWTLVSKLRI